MSLNGDSCIDKRSSAELSEAINSMFEWYEQAAICYAFLEDVNGSMEPDSRPPQKLVESRWFTRGWTLQELLAPSQVCFLDRNWSFLGSKHHAHTETDLTMAIAQRTGIPGAALLMKGKQRFRHPCTWSVARRISWASHRETSRIEDQAYCLLGLFNIKMPLLYGEGENAFLRLQQEILRQEMGESIFAWRTPTNMNAVGLSEDPLLASSATFFARAGNLQDRPTDGVPLITPRGSGFLLTIPPPPQELVYCHETIKTLLVLLRCYRLETTGKAKRRVRCILQLDYAEDCGHWSTFESRSRVCDESEIQNPLEYRPVRAGGTIYIHARNCNRRGWGEFEDKFLAGSSIFPAVSAGPFNARLAPEDAKRFHIKQ